MEVMLNWGALFKEERGRTVAIGAGEQVVRELDNILSEATIASENKMLNGDHGSTYCNVQSRGTKHRTGRKTTQNQWIYIVLLDFG